MAAWSATDDMESYSVASLNGDNGGSGWSAGYVASSVNVVSSPTLRGTRAVKIDSVSGGDATRALTTGVTSGIYRVYVLVSNLPSGTKGYFPTIFNDTGTLKFAINWGTSGSTGNTISFSDNNASFQVLTTSALANTLYYIEVEFDQTNNRARANFNGGSWSSYVTAAGGTFTSINGWRTTAADGNASDQGYYIDDIGVGAGPIAVATSGNLMMMGV